MARTPHPNLQWQWLRLAPMEAGGQRYPVVFQLTGAMSVPKLGEVLTENQADADSLLLPPRSTLVWCLNLLTFEGKNVTVRLLGRPYSGGILISSLLYLRP